MLVSAATYGAGGVQTSAVTLNSEGSHTVLGFDASGRVQRVSFTHDDGSGASFVVEEATLRPLFERWHPGLANDNAAGTSQPAAARTPHTFPWSPNQAVEIWRPHRQSGPARNAVPAPSVPCNRNP